MAPTDQEALQKVLVLLYTGIRDSGSNHGPDLVSPRAASLRSRRQVQVLQSVRTPMLIQFLSFLLIVPAILKLLMAKASLPIYGGAFLAHSPTTAIVSIDTVLAVPAGISAILDPVTLYLYNKNTTVFSPFLGLNLGKIHLNGHTTVNVSDSLVTILNQTEIESWFQAVVQDATTAVSVKGSTRVRLLGALSYPISIDKTEEIATLNKLAGFGLGGLELVLPADADGTNLMGNMTLPNWSPLTIGLGNVTLNVFSGSILVGTVHIQDVVAPPGNTTLPFRGEVYIDQILNNLWPIIQSQVSAIKDGNLNISACGNSTIINGQHIGYVENVLNNQLLSAQVSVLELATQLAGSLLSGNETLDDLGSLLGGLLGNLTSLATSSISSADVTSSMASILDGSLNMATLVSMISGVSGSGASQYSES